MGFLGKLAGYLTWPRYYAFKHWDQVPWRSNKKWFEYCSGLYDFMRATMQ